MTTLTLLATLTLVAAVVLRPALSGGLLAALVCHVALTAITALPGAASLVPSVLLSLVVASSSHGESHARCRARMASPRA